MKTLFAFVWLALVFVSHSAELPPPAAENKVTGRFRIYRSKYQEHGETVDLIIRVDTATGKAWRLTTVEIPVDPEHPKVGNVVYTGWDPLEENVMGKLVEHFAPKAK